MQQFSSERTWQFHPESGGSKEQGPPTPRRTPQTPASGSLPQQGAQPHDETMVKPATSPGSSPVKAPASPLATPPLSEPEPHSGTQSDTLARPVVPPLRPSAPGVDETLARPSGPPGLSSPPAPASPVSNPTDGPGAGDTLLRPGSPPPSTAHPAPSEHGETLLRDAASTGQRRSPFLHKVAGYEILGILGRGGMGVVYKARQTALNRVVALKMILAGAHANSDDLRRFHQEAEAVAALQHPNIVQVYEIGEHEGQPYFALEYIEGGSLRDHLLDQPLAPLDAARIVAQLARGMQHAHQRGIIHRDLKPANVLLAHSEVRSAASTALSLAGREAGGASPHIPLPPQKQVAGGEGRSTPQPARRNLQSALVKITDFGLAKKLEKPSDLTSPGMIVGTPSYMSPEQAEGRHREVGTGTDIYALGAILYDLLAGRPPFEGETLMDTLHKVLFADPPLLRQWQPHVPRDLEIIALKCLQKDPARRYASAAHLAEDLEAFLDQRPISARQTPWHEKAWLWARRRPAAAALAALVTLVVLGVAIGAPILAQREHELRQLAEHNEADAITQRNQADQQRLRAEKNFQQATLAVEEMLTRVAQERLADEPRLTRVRRDLLNKALGFYQRFVRDLGPQPEVRWQRARAWRRIGEIQEQLGALPAGRDALLQGRGELQQLVSEFPQESHYRADLAGVLDALGRVQQQLGATIPAEQALREAINIFRPLASSNDPELLLEFAKLHNHLGNLLMTDPRRATDAIEVYRAGLRLADGLPQSARGLSLALEQARMEVNLAGLLQPTAPNEANAYLELGQRRLLESTPPVTTPDFLREQGRMLLNVGETRQQRGETKLARHCYEGAIGVLAKLVDDFPDITDYRYLLALTWTNLSLLEQHARDAEAAARARTTARRHWLRLVEQAPNPTPYRQALGRNWHTEALYLATKGNSAETEDAFHRAVQLQERLVAETGSAESRIELAQTQRDLGKVAMRNGQLETAERWLKQALSTLAPAQKAGPLSAEGVEVLRDTHLNLILFYQQTQRETAAEPHVRALVALVQPEAERLRDARSCGDLAALLYTLGVTIQQRRDYPAARQQLEQSCRWQELALQAQDSPAGREGLNTYQLQLLQVLRLGKDHAAVSRLAGEIGRQSPVLGAKAAAELSQCLPLLKQDSQLDQKTRAQLSERYGKQSVELLAAAFKAGFKDRQWLQKGAEWEPLRQRADFSALVAP